MFFPPPTDEKLLGWLYIAFSDPSVVAVNINFKFTKTDTEKLVIAALDLHLEASNRHCLFFQHKTYYSK